MIVTVNSQALVAELRLLSKVVPTKPAIAILSYVLLRADEGLSLCATDLEVALGTSCPARVDAPGAVVLPCAKLLTLCEQFTDGDVIVAADKQAVTIKCGAFTSKLQTLADADFPKVPSVEGASSVVDGDVLKELIGRTRYAINATTSKYILKGALLTLAGPVAAMVATDAKRLALATASRTGPDARFVIPVKALDALVGHLSGDCEVTLGEKHLFFASGGRLLSSRTIVGQFPAYEKIIPRDNALVATVDRLALAAALRRVNLVSEEDGAVYFGVEPGRLTLSSSSAEVGTADEVVSAGCDFTLKVCMNGGYVLDFLNAARNKAVTMAFKDANSQALLNDGDDHVAVIMTMRGR